MENPFFINKTFSKIEFNTNDFVSVNIIKSQSSKLSSVYLLSLEKLCEFIDNDPNSKINKHDLLNFFISNHRLDFSQYSKNFLSEVIILIMLGFLNNRNKQFSFFKNLFINDLPEECYLSQNIQQRTYTEYILEALDYLPFENYSIENVKKLKDCIFKMGFIIDEKIFKKIEKLTYFNFDKILIILTPGDNLWFKTDKPCINNQNYERKYDGKDIYVFYNWELIKQFMDKIGSHPRCKIGLLSSLSKTNLKENFDLILNKEILKENSFLNDFYLFDEESHEKIENRYDNNLILFKRSLNKITEKIEDKLMFSEKKILILESEENKCDSIMENVIMMNCFSEEILKSDGISRQRINNLIEYLINYILNMLDSDSIIDVQKYLKENPFYINEFE